MPLVASARLCEPDNMVLSFGGAAENVYAIGMVAAMGWVKTIVYADHSFATMTRFFMVTHGASPDLPVFRVGDHSYPLCRRHAIGRGRLCSGQQDTGEPPCARQ
jgi:hypothetical protein